MLPPQSDHQSEGLLHSLFLGCVSRGLLGFSHEDIIDFDIGAHGPHSVSCVSMHDIIHIRGRDRQPEVPVATRHSIESQPGASGEWPASGRACPFAAWPSFQSPPAYWTEGRRSTLLLVPLSQPQPRATAVLVDELGARTAAAVLVLVAIGPKGCARVTTEPPDGRS
jgi:hypothetical protein